MAQLKLKAPVGPPLTNAEMKSLKVPVGALLANVRRQRRRDYDPVRYYYLDRPFSCKLCGKSEVWTTKQQKFWYEDCKGDPNAVAIHCRACRKEKSGRSAT